jgi:hypothetical protein
MAACEAEDDERRALGRGMWVTWECMSTQHQGLREQPGVDTRIVSSGVAM